MHPGRVARKRLKKTFFNVGFILSEMKSGRPAYLGNEELDVRNQKALGLPHGAVIAVGTVFYLALACPPDKIDGGNHASGIF